MSHKTERTSEGLLSIPTHALLDGELVLVVLDTGTTVEGDRLLVVCYPTEADAEHWHQVNVFESRLDDLPPPHRLGSKVAPQVAALPGMTPLGIKPAAALSASLEVGSRVKYRGAWGAGDPQPGTITGIGAKNGRPVYDVELDAWPTADTEDDLHRWGYSGQFEPLGTARPTPIRHLPYFRTGDA